MLQEMNQTCMKCIQIDIYKHNLKMWSAITWITQNWEDMMDKINNEFGKQVKKSIADYTIYNIKNWLI